MSEYAGMTAHYTKRRGKIRCCEWCGHAIAIGDKYASWLWYADGQRSTVYAHDECCDAWAEECHNDYGGVHHSDGQNQRPAKGENEMTEKQTNIHIAYCWRCDWSGSVTNGENICPSCQTLSLRHKSRHKIYCATQNERRIESQREINGPCNCMTIAEPYEDQKRKQPPEQEQPR